MNGGYNQVPRVEAQGYNARPTLEPTVVWVPSDVISFSRKSPKGHNPGRPFPGPGPPHLVGQSLKDKTSQCPQSPSAVLPVVRDVLTQSRQLDPG